MAKSIKLLVYPVSDVEKAKTFYNAFLGVEPYADSPYYVGYRIGDQEIGLDPHSKEGPSLIQMSTIFKPASRR